MHFFGLGKGTPLLQENRFHVIDFSNHKSDGTKRRLHSKSRTLISGVEFSMKFKKFDHGTEKPSSAYSILE